MVKRGAQYALEMRVIQLTRRASARKLDTAIVHDEPEDHRRVSGTTVRVAAETIATPAYP